jgi:WD40 repeat protein
MPPPAPPPGPPPESALNPARAALRARYHSQLTRLNGLQRAKEELIDWRGVGYAARTESSPQFDFRVRRTLQAQSGRVTALSWGGDGFTLASASATGRVVLWNANLEALVGSVTLADVEWPCAVALEPTRDELLAVGGLSQGASVYRMADILAAPGASARIRPTAVLGDGGGGGGGGGGEDGRHGGHVAALGFPSAERLATASGDGTLGVWDLTLVHRSATLVPPGPRSAQLCLACLGPRDPEFLISGGADGWVRAWDLRLPPSSACVMALGGFEGAVNGCDVFPSGMAVGAAGEDSTVRLFDLRSAGAVGVYAEEAIVVGATGCAFSRSGRLLFASYADMGLCVAWEPLSADGLLHELRGHQGTVSCVALNCEGQAVATGGHDGKVNIWA